MRYRALALVLATISLASVARAQDDVVSAAVLQAAQRSAGTAQLLNVHRLANDSVVVELEDKDLSFNKFQNGTWTWSANAVGASARTSSTLTPKQVGRVVAQTVFAGIAPSAGIKTVVVEVHSRAGSADSANLRFFYRASELTVR